MMKLRAMVFVGLACLALDSAVAGQSPLEPRTVSGRVVRVQDGDTLTVFARRQLLKVRLSGVDAPEKRQAGGPEAKAFTSNLTLGKRVTVAVEAKQDRYQRSLGVITLPDGRKLNQELVRAGHAWWYRAYSKDQTLQALEDAARKAKAGLWAAEQPVPPWEFRRRK